MSSGDKKTVSRSKKKVKGLFKDDDTQSDHTAKNVSASSKTASGTIKRTGYMETRMDKEGWKVVFCVLVEGSLFLYKNSTVC